MNLYEIGFPGHWLGGTAIVAAPDEARALHMMKLALPEHGLPSDEPVIRRKLDPSVPSILYIDNGDY